MIAGLRDEMIRVNGVRLHCMRGGEGPLVVLLHGFPEFWYSWRHQIPALIDAGFEVLVPDMRGYNTSEKPSGVSSYTMRALVDDVAGLVHHSGNERAVVVGHDWGGMVAWQTALRRPDVVRRLVIMNAPHPAIYARAVFEPDQARRSRYVLYFLLPRLPERTLSADGFSFIDRLLRDQPVRPGAFSDEDIARYKEALAQPGALTAVLNYYRAAVRGGLWRWPRAPAKPGAGPRRTGLVSAPALVIWGERDSYLGIRLLDGLEQYVPDLEVVRIPESSHWVQVDAADQVNRALLAFLARP